MGTSTTWCDCSLRSAALERNELMDGKGANRIIAVPFHSIRSSGSRRLSPTGRCRERRPALSRFIPSPTINSVHSIAASLKFTRRSFFEIRDCQSSGRCRERRNSLSWFSPFVRMRELRRPVKPRHRRSFLHGNTNYVA
jgi:hypothetical protein